MIVMYATHKTTPLTPVDVSAVGSTLVTTTGTQTTAYRAMKPM
jgi:hypothetical protein